VFIQESEEDETVEQHFVKAHDAPPHSLKDSNANWKMKTTKEGIWIHSLACDTLAIEGRVRVPK
jgi:hypothetical protein